MGSGTELSDRIAEELVGDVEPVRMEGFGFAARILPTFRLIRALFSQNEVDTCLKLMLLFELTRTEGRSSIERIRVLNRYLDAERVDLLVQSLKSGGWLELRAIDTTYAVAPLGLNLLSLLHAADFGNLSPANALARAAQNASFGTTLSGADEGASSYLLEQLLVLLQGQVDEAHVIIQRGTPRRMIAWSQRAHRHQLETIRQVLATLYEHLDESSREFGRVVRLHEAMQDVIRLHASIHARLRDWNLEKLYTSDAGYSLPELADAVIGADEIALNSIWTAGILDLPVLAPSVTTEEIEARFEGARRRLSSQREDYVYVSPLESAPVSQDAPLLDAGGMLRARLTEWFRREGSAGTPCELPQWLSAAGFSDAGFDLAMLARLAAPDGRIGLDDERGAVSSIRTSLAEGAAPGRVLDQLTDEGALVSTASGRFGSVTLRIEGPRSRAGAGPIESGEEEP